MLLVHQAGSVKVGEVVRYTLTYTPSSDRILPSPTHLHVKIKNTSPMPLRAAYLHGPYSLHVCTYPSTFNPNHKVEDPAKHGIPEFEPFLKAGAHWTCNLVVPEDIRESGDSHGSPSRASMDSISSVGTNKGRKSATWLIEIASQIIFSNTASVHFELLVGRDERSLDLGFAAIAAQGHGAPGHVADHKKPQDRRSGTRGVYSRAIKLVVEDTEDLWDKPKLPDSKSKSRRLSRDGLSESKPATPEKKSPKKKKQKVHLVVLTHGLHSNLHADMLYLKESIDATVAQAREDARRRREDRKRNSTQAHSSESTPQGKNEKGDAQGATATAPTSGGQEDISDDEDEEQVIVRGFSGNSVRTERGIQYLGKRLARYVLHLTYPTQPYVPLKKKVSTSIIQKLGSSAQDKKDAQNDQPPTHRGSSIHRDDTHHTNDLAYQFTSISFVGHSLGGLVQLYAIAYIQKHAPDFFKLINPVNFICMASPLLGLSNENPMYVKFALDFGLVGRTGQDLGLTWRAPTIAKSGWSAMGGVFGASKDQKQPDPGAKPLLRILPTGPAHQVLHLFRNRTVYSNVVNDGIVPLRTSCLLFLDWKGLAKIEKYRRQQGLLGTMVEWGWAEMTGATAERDVSLSPDYRGSFSNSKGASPQPSSPQSEQSGDAVPQPSDSATEEDNKASGAMDPSASKYLHPRSSKRDSLSSVEGNEHTTGHTSSMFDGIINFFRTAPTPPSPRSPKSPKAVKALVRGQTLTKEQEDELAAERDTSPHSRPEPSRRQTDNPTMRPDASSSRPTASRGDSVEHAAAGLVPPPKTSVFESASDILHPPIPSTQWIIDPSTRPRTIFHDRVYHPADIPPPTAKRPLRSTRSFSSDSITRRARSDSQLSNASSASQESASGMKVEEKIARAYHHDLSWRKVLVRLEPDAHNNMIVRRMFANAYGWPVVKHLCDTHFSDSYAARTRDAAESNKDRAATKDSTEEGVRKDEGEEVRGQTAKARPPPLQLGSQSETRDELGSLESSAKEIGALKERHKAPDTPSAPEGWTGGFWDSDCSSEDEDEGEDRRGWERLKDLAMSKARGKGKEPASRDRVLHDAGADRKASQPDIILSPEELKEHLTAEPESLDE